MTMAKRDVLLRQLTLSPGGELYPEILHRTVEAMKEEVATAAVREGWTPVGRTRVKIVVEQDVEAELVCDGCNVRGVWEHRCLSCDCPCVDCREEDLIFGVESAESAESAEDE